MLAECREEENNIETIKVLLHSTSPMWRMRGRERGRFES